MTQPNAAAWLDAAGAKLRVGPVERHQPGKGQVLIEIHAVAINPVDSVQQETGMLVDKFPFIQGVDASGVVVEIGDGVTNVATGDRVVAFMHGSEGRPRGAFQNYAVAPELVVSPLPDEIPFTKGASIPVAFLTAIAGLYHQDYLNLPLPQFDVKSTGKSVLIWGGATSVGSITVQLARASGLNVITTSSPKNFEFCKRIGANDVYDYNSSTVVDDIKTALQGQDFAGVYEASGMDDAMQKSIEILSALGGGFMAGARWPPKELPSNVRAEFMQSDKLLWTFEKRARYLWHEFLPAALKSGQIKPEPPIEVVGKGLEAVQVGIDAWRKGVSAKKIVVEL